MNQLQNYIILHNLSELHTMNLLQDQGIISDNCIRAEDVADSDCPNAIAFLQSTPST